MSTLKLPSSPDNHTRKVLPTKATDIIDYRATDFYFSIDAPVVDIDRAAPKITVGTATGQTQQSTGIGGLNLPHLLSGFPIKRHLMPGFRHTFVGLSPLCDADCTVNFTRNSVIVREKKAQQCLQVGVRPQGPYSGEYPYNQGSQTFPVCLTMQIWLH